ncbi:MAG: FIST N-terminal domain-containing protein [Chloroflexota bacterium]
MRIDQTIYRPRSGWETVGDVSSTGNGANLVLAFGARHLLENSELLREMKGRHPGATVIGCSTAGEISGTSVLDGSIVCTAIGFQKTAISTGQVFVKAPEDSRDAGRRLAGAIEHRGLVHAFVLSDGLKINGSELVKGLTEALPTGVTVTGGLSGDDDRFEKTIVVCGEEALTSNVVIVGFYGESLRVGYGSLGGWDPFGPERIITRSHDNVLYEMDNTSALELYKNYLGDQAAGLPATGLLFPLALRADDESKTAVVRTILAVDDSAQSMTFAGDMPEGGRARLMKANFDRLIDGAAGAARTSYEALGGSNAELAILISCVGRKMVLKQRVEEEVEGVRDVVGNRTVLAGFYSYGEISPFTPSARCELHNQTMTVTTLSEV